MLESSQNRQSGKILFVIGQPGIADPTAVLPAFEMIHALARNSSGFRICDRPMPGPPAERRTGAN